MKRIILSILTVSMLAATSLQGQAAPLNRPATPQAEFVQVDYRKPAPRHNNGPKYNKQAYKYDNKRSHNRYGKQTVKKPKHHVHKRHDWKRGQRYSDWRRHAPVRDYHRYGLKRPGPGQQWIKVDNDYLLLSLATGLIAGVIAAR
ncbi:RcnB family protein [Aquamicrobium segne]|uniref:RcnB family protein n=1 Tax=Aquamicrobium segne TaxID=469547 RepID=A0ABW0GSH6_9HYPH